MIVQAEDDHVWLILQLTSCRSVVRTNDHVQSYYVIALLGGFVFGILNVGLGVTEMLK